MDASVVRRKRREAQAQEATDLAGQRSPGGKCRIPAKNRQMEIGGAGRPNRSCRPEIAGLHHGQEAPLDTTTIIDEKERQARLRLSLVRGVGTVRFAQAMEVFGSALATLAAPRKRLAEVLDVEAARQITSTAGMRAVDETIERQDRLLETVGARRIVVGENDYPTRLLDRGELVPTICALGDISVTRQRCVAIVGRRAATGVGQKMATRLAARLTEKGRVVVSGGAYGIDAAAHVGAMDAGGQTLCVFGAGIDIAYPERHIDLFRRIANQGCIVSQFEPGTQPQRGCFLRRNRIIAALAEAVIVVEAGARSGARSTALAARSMDGPVWSVPGSMGTDRLIAEGAEPLSNIDDLDRLLDGHTTGSAPKGPHNKDLTGPQRTLLDVLAKGPARLPGDLARQSGLPPGRVMAVLVELQLHGLVVAHAGGRYETTYHHPASRHERES